MNKPYAGGCACGAFRYECSADPIRMVQCHCLDCQRTGGGPFVTAIIVPADSVKILKGGLRFYATTSSLGGSVQRGFCPECGSPVLVKIERAPQIVGLRGGSLDDSSWFRPDFDMWTCDAQPWDYMNPALPKFEQYPPVGRPKEPAAPKP